MTGKPSVFLGSSREGLEVARAIGYQLREDAEVTIWNEGVFAPGESTLESLVNALERFDFAVLVLTPDDPVTTREDTRLQPRDNLMFELGLFMGRLGRARTFAVCPGQEELKLPSDLAGVTLLTYDPHRGDGNLKAAVSAACVQIRDSLRDLGLSEVRTLQRLTETSSRVEGYVQEAVDVLVRSRAWETELFRTFFAPMMDEEQRKRLETELEELKRVTRRGNSNGT